MRLAHRLMIASVGDDIHSVGMALMTLAFEERGFLVTNLGIGNSLDDVFRLASRYDAILISCNNGHAALYLDNFAAGMASFKLTDDGSRLWYLGGNLSVNGDDETTVHKYRRMGFDFVAPKPIPFEAVHDQLMRDFHNRSIPMRYVSDDVERPYPEIPCLSAVSDEPLSDDDFMNARRAILASWKTGAQVYSANVEQNHLVASQNVSHILKKALSSAHRPLLQPRTGVAHTCDEIAILQHLRKHGLDISSIQLDAASRKNMYAQAEEGLRRSEKGKPSFLNGYPIPVHGVRGIQQIIAAIDTPFQVRAGSPDHRLTYEIALAGGASSLEGGFLCYLFPYDARTSPVSSLQNWKYVDKLTGWYARRYGITVNREYFGPLTTNLIEPTVPICINIVQALLSAKSGVKCISVGLAEQGNRIQDVAAVQVLRFLTKSYLNSYGYRDVCLSTVYHHYMAAFPEDYQRARALIENSSTTGSLARATKILIKTPVESFKIPDKEDNAEALRLSLSGIVKADNLEMDHVALRREYGILKRQVVGVMNLVEQLGKGSLARGLIRAFQQSVLEIPFSPSRYNPNRQITVRDCDGAIRFMRPELLPFDNELVDYHLDRVHHRMTRERSTRPSELLAQDLTRIPKGDYSGWPLDSHYVT
jgi:methylaspartate mutase epsilon subunit